MDRIAAFHESQHVLVVILTYFMLCATAIVHNAISVLQGVVVYRNRPETTEFLQAWRLSMLSPETARRQLDDQGSFMDVLATQSWAVKHNNGVFKRDASDEHVVLAGPSGTLKVCLCAIPLAPKQCPALALAKYAMCTPVPCGDAQTTTCHCIKMLATHMPVQVFVLPTVHFPSGKTLFDYHLPSKYGSAPYAVHATFQRYNNAGKRSRFRELGVLRPLFIYVYILHSVVRTVGLHLLCLRSEEAFDDLKRRCPPWRHACCTPVLCSAMNNDLLD